jgi:cytochrome c-type biogenesis protein CcsB
MEKISKALFSMRMMALAMIIFLLAIAAATFIESAYDVQAAKLIIYNALWFEILLLFLSVNLIANIFRYQMFKREKIAMLTFHLSFLVIIIGAAITRYISFEGLMIIPEGQESNIIYSSDPHLWLKINDGKLQYTYAEKMFMSEITSNDFDIPIDFPNHKTPVKIEYVNFQKKMIDSLVTNDSINATSLEIVTDGMRPNYLCEGNFLMVGDIPISFEKKDAMPGVLLFKKGNTVTMKSDFPVRYLPMSQMQKYRQSGQPVPDTAYIEIPAKQEAQFMTTTLYTIGNQQFVFKNMLKNTKMMLMPSGKRNVGTDYLTVKITDGEKSKEVVLKGGINQIPDHEVFELNGLSYEMEYGSMRIELPFSVKCNDFQIENYPGSNAPSSYASEVTIIDTANDYTRNQRIFMNHVMDYNGYRFFQSAYDLDDPNTPQNEEGTRLSVNADWWGTNITYLGYLLMAIGMVLSLLAPAGRFRALNDKLKKLRQKRSGLSAILAILFTLSYVKNTNAQHEGHNHDGHNHEVENQALSAPTEPVIISEAHADELGRLLVQVPMGPDQGRIVPLHTMCLNLLRKIHRADKFENLNAVQTIMSMHLSPASWMDKKIIQVPSALREELKLESYASIKDLITDKNEFKWAKQYEAAFQKLESKRNEFDKNLLKLTDRFQLINAFPSWDYMRLCPLKNDKNNTWYVPLDERLFKGDSTAFYTAMGYFKEVFLAAKSNDYAKASTELKKLKDIQRKSGAKVVPSEFAVDLEVRYNKLNVFKSAQNSYLGIGLLSLLIFFLSIFTKTSSKVTKVIRILGKAFTFLLILVFIYHGLGLAMRWYISGHAPWSNGYEAVVFIAWVTMLSGFIFSRKNPSVLAGTALLAGLMIWVTQMNLLDPEITPLQPVLKSYWLMIHVAIITGSYGFLGLSAILGLFNLILFIFRTKRNAQLVTIHISEITYISEMTMTVGLFMLTIGTFLGGIWANESWGRYWGWDPKETWALVSVLVYAVILHLRYIPGLSGKFLFNTVSLWGYAAILFTFFGVNFYLVGLHSYAQGEGLGAIPSWLITTIILFVLFTALAAWRNKSFKLNQEALNEDKHE